MAEEAAMETEPMEEPFEQDAPEEHPRLHPSEPGTHRSAGLSLSEPGEQRSAGLSLSGPPEGRSGERVQRADLEAERVLLSPAETESRTERDRTGQLTGPAA